MHYSFIVVCLIYAEEALVTASKVRQGQQNLIQDISELQILTGLQIDEPDTQSDEHKENMDEQNESALTLVTPHVWALLGPFMYKEYGVDPLRAFKGGIQDVADQAPADFWKEMHDRAGKWKTAVSKNSKNSTYDGALALLAENLEDNVTHMPSEAQAGIGDFPTEVGPGGKTLWGFTYTNFYQGVVPVNWTLIALEAGWNITHFIGETGHGGGWAVGEIDLENAGTVLAKCSSPFLVGSSTIIRLPDVYKESRAVHSLILPAGKTRVLVNTHSDKFWCDFAMDSALARRNLTTIPDESNGTSPLIVLRDSMMSEVVASKLPSPYLAIPVLNSARSPLRLKHAKIVDGPVGLSILNIYQKLPIESGQVMILRLEIEQTAAIECARQSNKTPFVLNMTVALVPDGDHAPAIARIITACRDSPSHGYIVTYPEIDGSIQRLWAAPPNITRFEDRRCPASGCPVMLSLHGASVGCGPVWGTSYEYTGPNASNEGFPYPAWLVQPTNRYHWGTDWEGPGLDNAIAALLYVRDSLPGAPGNGSLDEKRKIYGADAERVLVTGHSMGGHGTFVFATHFPDQLIGAASSSGWASLDSYSGTDMASPLLDAARRGLLEAVRSEHAADFAYSNLKGLPMMITYGSKDDNVPPTEPRSMARLIDSASGSTDSVEVVELPNVGHWFGQGVAPLAAWFEKRFSSARNLGAAGESLPMPGLPESFDFKVSNPSTFGSKGSLQVLQQVDPAEPAQFFVQRCAEGATTPVCDDVFKSLDVALERRGEILEGSDGFDRVWRVETSNVRRLALLQRMPGRPWPQALQVDGSLFSGEQLNSTGCKHLCRLNEDSRTWKVCSSCSWKQQRGGSSVGPIQMALRKAPLCIAYGSGPQQKEHAVNLAEKLYFISRYASPVVNASKAEGAKQDEIVLPGECNSSNLLLVGPPSENSWTDQYKCSFPYVRFSDLPANHPGGRGFSLAGHSYSADRTGLLALGSLPNGRLALLLHGVDAEGLARAASAVPVTSGRHSADFMVFGPDYGWKGEGGLLAAGYLNHLWQVSRSSWSEPEHAVAPLRGRPQVPPGPDPACTAWVLKLQGSDEEETASESMPIAQDKLSERSGAKRYMLKLLCHLGILAVYL